MGKCVMAILAIVLGCGPVLGADGPATPAKELVQYIMDAKRLGVKEAAIRKNAIAAGWPAGAVDAAIAYNNQTRLSQGTGHQAATPPASHAGGELSAAQEVETSAPGTPPVKPSATDALETQKDRGVPDDYHIGAGDVLQISVWKEPDASVPSVVVRPDGNISMPLLKEISVVGLTPMQLERSITEGLSKFINAVDVTVMVAAINSKKVYVVGGARREGPLAYTYRMTIMQAISEAGGLNDYAKRKKIYVLRTANGKEYKMPFNYNEALKGQKTEQNIVLLPGDTIIIPQ
jgi:polysaccharide biosynthesis/export protein